MARPKRRSLLAILGGALGTVCLCCAGVSVIGRGAATPTPAPAAIGVTIMAPTAAPTPSAAPSPTVPPATIAPSATIAPPTEAPPTEAPTSTPVLPAQPVAGVPADQNLANVRAGPGLSYQVIGQLLSGQSAPIVGQARAADMLWWQITWLGVPGDVGWVADQVVVLSGDTSGVPVVEAPALPVEAAPAPTQAPEAAPPTAEPVAAPPEPTQAPATSPGEPTYTGSGSGRKVDPAWWPCQQGQVKGNLNSMIYHWPGARDYSKTFSNVQCFDTDAEAEAAGFRRAQR